MARYYGKIANLGIRNMIQESPQPLRLHPLLSPPCRVGLILSLCVFLMMGCSDRRADPIKIGINPWPGYEFLYLADVLGYYDQLGVPVKIIEYSSLSDVRRGYERGKLDAMTSTLVEVLQVKHYSNREPMVVLATDFSAGGDVIIARKPIGTPSQLKGKRVGADTSSLPIYLLSRSLDLHGLSLHDVEVVPLEQTDLEQAYMDGTIDAIATYPPISVRLQARDDSTVIFTSKEIPGEIIDVLSVEKSVLTHRRSDIALIHQAWDMAIDFAEEHPDKAYEIMANREGISADEFREALTDIKIIDLQGQYQHFPSLKKILRQVKQVLTETKLLTDDIPDDCCIANLFVNE